MDGVVRGGRTATATCREGDGRSWRRNGRRCRLRPTRIDSLDEEVEGDAAELLPRFDLLGEAPVDGDAVASSATSRPCRLGLGFRVTERKWVRGEREMASVAILTTGGARRQ